MQAREAIEAPPLRRLRHRLPWLLLGLLGSSLATVVVARFETLLLAAPAVAFFVPGLVYLADAIGTQTEAVAVRGLSLSHSRLSALVGGEVRTGLLIGLVMGGLTLPGVWLVCGDPRLAFAVAGALVVALPRPSGWCCPGFWGARAAIPPMAAGRWPRSSRTC